MEIPDFGVCSCGQPASTVVVTFNGWVLDLCVSCAQRTVDPIGVQR